MKAKITNLAMLMAMNGLAFGLMAQITINQADYPRGTTFTDNFIVTAQTGITLPSEGAAQTWDFSTGFTTDSAYSQQYFDATSDPDFPNTLNRRPKDLDFQGFLISRDEYETIDANGWYYSGAKIRASDYSLQAITGGPNDSLHFLALNDIYAGRADYLQFPLNYQDTWVNSQIETVEFELTVASAGLNRTPGKQKRTRIHSREVVGFGTLKIPLANGSPSQPFDVLLIKATVTVVDSFFVGGMPAPPPLLAAFGLSQGQTDSEDSYIFYRKGFSFPVMGMSIENGKGERLNYRPQAGIISLDEWNLLSNSSAYPNPATAGKSLTIEFDQEDEGLMDFILLDLTGRKIYQQEGIMSSEGLINAQLPANLPEGNYFYQLKKPNGPFLAGGKLNIE